MRIIFLKDGFQALSYLIALLLQLLTHKMKIIRIACIIFVLQAIVEFFLLTCASLVILKIIAAIIILILTLMLIGIFFREIGNYKGKNIVLQNQNNTMLEEKNNSCTGKDTNECFEKASNRKEDDDNAQNIFTSLIDLDGKPS